MNKYITCGIKPTSDGSFAILGEVNAKPGDKVLAMEGQPDSPYSHVSCEGVVILADPDGSYLVESEAYPAKSSELVKIREWYYTVCEEIATAKTMLKAAELLIEASQK